MSDDLNKFTLETIGKLYLQWQLDVTTLTQRLKETQKERDDLLKLLGKPPD